MICTVTFNPSLDYIVSVDDFQLGMTNRTSSELILPGGKGINVSIVLKNLGLDSTALGYAAGFTGEELIRRLTEFGVAMITCFREYCTRCVIFPPIWDGSIICLIITDLP